MLSHLSENWFNDLDVAISKSNHGPSVMPETQPVPGPFPSCGNVCVSVSAAFV
jgi:hypothetical protein